MGQGDHTVDEDGGADDERHGPPVSHLVNLGRGDVVLHEGLESVGDALQESPHTDHGSASVHTPTEDLTLLP